MTLFSNSILVVGVDDGYMSLSIYQNAQICIAWWVNPTISKLRKTHNKAFLWIYRLSGKPPLISKFVILPMLACNGASSKLRNNPLITLSKLLKVSKTKFEFSLSDAFQSAEDNCLAKHIVKNKSKIFCLKYQNLLFQPPYIVHQDLMKTNLSAGNKKLIYSQYLSSGIRVSIFWFSILDSQV